MGAALAATLMIRRYRQNPIANDYVFKCAVFISGSLPYDYAALLRGEICMFQESTDGILIGVPTANIWGLHDKEWPHAGIELTKICNKAFKSEFTHDAGHTIPNSPKDVVAGMANAVKRAIEAITLTY